MHPLSRLVQHLETWEKEVLFLRCDLASLRLRFGLGYKGSDKQEVMPAVYEKICSLFTMYSMLDLGNRYEGLGPFPVIPGLGSNQNQMKSLEQKVTGKIKVWDKLVNWPRTLQEARHAIESKEKISPTKTSPVLKKNPHCALAFELVRTKSNQKYDNVRSNFQMAALYASYVMRMPGLQKDAFPDIPDNVAHLLMLEPDDTTTSEFSADFEATAKEVQDVIKKFSASRLRLPLQLALGISPICLMTTRSGDMKGCDREVLLKASKSLGNVRPPLLKELEKAILLCLFRVASTPEDLEKELSALIRSEVWRKCENLESSSEAARFFIPDQGSHIAEIGDDPSSIDVPSPQARIVLLPTEGEDPEQMNVGRPCNIDAPQDVTMIEILHDTAKDGQGITTDAGADPDNDAHAEPEVEEEAVEERENEMLERIRKGQEDPKGSISMDQVVMTGDNDKSCENDDTTEHDDMIQEVSMNGEDPEGDGDKPCQDDDAFITTEDDNASKNKEVSMEEEDSNEHARIHEEEASTGPSWRSLRAAPQGSTDMKASTTSTNSSRKRKRSKKASGSLDLVGPDPLSAKNVAQIQYIDVDLWLERSITLDVEAQPDKIQGQTMNVHLPHGGTTPITPHVHDMKTADTLKKLWTAVENAYVDGLPLHLARPSASAFSVIKGETFDQTSVEDVQVILENQHLVVTAREGHEELEFKKALQQLGSMDTVMTIQDQSIRVGRNQNPRRREGTLRQLLMASQSPKGKVLNALDIGLPGSGFQETPYASNAAALMDRRGDWKLSSSPPMEDVNWALAATSGAFHTWHIDCNGFMTFVSPVCGQKLWIVGHPYQKGIQQRFYDFANVDLYLSTQYDLNGANDDRWRPEAILLGPGDILQVSRVMRPNTPHAVFTPKPSVVRGGHCYARATLPDTLVGIIHTFIAGDLITNTEHRSARFHLQEMINFYHGVIIEDSLDEDDERWAHVPELTSESGHKEVLAVCVFGILINVLDFGTYIHPNQLGNKMSAEQRAEMKEKDVNSLSHEQRMGCMYTRGQALQLLDHIAQNYEHVFVERWPNLESYHEDVIAHQCGMIFKYKEKARGHVEGAPGCDCELLKLQLLGLAVEGSTLDTKIQNALGQTWNESENLTLLGPDTAAHLREKTDVVEQKMVHPLHRGTNTRDRIYHAARTFKVEHQDHPLPLKKHKAN